MATKTDNDKLIEEMTTEMKLRILGGATLPWTFIGPFVEEYPQVPLNDIVAACEQAYVDAGFELAAEAHQHVRNV